MLVIESSKPCEVLVDGQLMDSLLPGEYLKVESFSGDHIISAVAYSRIYSFKTKIALGEEQVTISIQEWKLHRNKLLNEAINGNHERISFRPKEERIGLFNQFGEKEKFMAGLYFQSNIQLVSDKLYTSPDGEMLVAITYKSKPYFVKMNDLYFEIVFAVFRRIEFEKH